jgi:hypothetical protein
MMKRTLTRLLLLIMLASSTVSAAVSHKVFETATSGTPIVIAILADHYTDETKFENDVKNFITYGLLAHPFYADHVNDFQIETFFDAVSAGEVSKYGFNVEAPSQNCLLSWEVGTTQATNTWLKVQAVVGGINPRHTIVIGDHPYSIGCTDGEWTYVTEDAAGSDMLAHEFGHGIGQLYDEWVLARNRGRDHPGLSADPEIARNCHHTDNGATAPWTFPLAAMYPGCDLYEGKVVHAYDHMTMYGSHSYCLMGPTSNAEFCPVCRHYMNQEFEYLDNPDTENPRRDDNHVENPDTHNPPPPPPTDVRIIRAAFVQDPRKVVPPAASAQDPKRVPPAASTQDPKRVVPPPIPLLAPGATGPIVRLIVSIDPATGQIVAAKKAFPINARYAPSHRRFGEYAYEILNGDQVLGTGVVPSSLFRTRDYQGGGHSTSDAHVADVTIQMPGVTADMVRDTNSSLSIRVWWLGPNVTEKLITPTTLTKLIQEKRVGQRGQLTAEQIRAAL